MSSGWAESAAWTISLSSGEHLSRHGVIGLGRSGIRFLRSDREAARQAEPQDGPPATKPADRHSLRPSTINSPTINFMVRIGFIAFGG